MVSEWGKGEDAAVDLGTGKDPTWTGKDPTWPSHFLSVVTLRNSAGVERPVSEAILGSPSCFPGPRLPCASHTHSRGYLAG